MQASDRHSSRKRAVALGAWLIFSLALVVLTGLPFTSLFPELGDLGGPLLAVSALVCVLSWCSVALAGIAIVFRRSLGWVARGFALVVLLPLAGTVSAYEVYARAGGRDEDRVVRFAMHDFDGERLRRQWHEATRNADGWRSPLAYLPAGGESLTFFIGDSFVFGAVGQDDMIDAILRNDYLGESHLIYNFGRPGAGLDDYLGVARQYRPLDPDNVLVFLYVGNDIPTRRHSSHWPTSCPPCDVLRGLADRVALFRRLGRQLHKMSLMSKVRPETLAALARSGIDASHLNPSYLAWIYPDSPAAGLSEDFVAEMAAEFEGSEALQDRLLSIAETFRGTNFCFVLIPFHFQVSRRYVEIESAFHLPIDAPLGRQAQDALLAWADRHGRCMIDLLPAFRDEQARTDDLLFYPLDGHLRPVGNAVLARTLHERGLLRRGE